ncbi:MAG: hypothetical protein R3Y55_03815 [Rikenellaceae bacterium]
MKITTNGITVELTEQGTYAVTYPWGKNYHTQEFRSNDTLQDVKNFIWNITNRENGDAVLAALEDFENLRTELAAEKAKVADLEARLKRSLEMDAIMENQELITLKHTLAEDLKLQYTDWQEAKDREMGEDEYVFRGAVIKRVFQVLTRNGIKF